MNLRKLNEELNKLLIHELSPETRQWATDEREARYLAAQATADREKEKFEKNKQRKTKLNPKTNKEIKDSLTFIANSISDGVETDFSDIQIKDDNFIIVIDSKDVENGKLNKTAEKRLKELLNKMSKKYGCNYSYKVKGTKVEIICEKPNIKTWYEQYDYKKYGISDKLYSKIVHDFQLNIEHDEYIDTPDGDGVIQDMNLTDLASVELLPFFVPLDYCYMNNDNGSVFDRKGIHVGCSPTDDLGYSIYVNGEEAPSYAIQLYVDNMTLILHKYWDEELNDYHGYDDIEDEAKEDPSLIISRYPLNIDGMPFNFEEYLEFIPKVIKGTNTLMDKLVKYLKSEDTVGDKSDKYQKRLEKLNGKYFSNDDSYIYEYGIQDDDAIACWSFVTPLMDYEKDGLDDFDDMHEYSQMVFYNDILYEGVRLCSRLYEHHDKQSDILYWYVILEVNLLPNFDGDFSKLRKELDAYGLDCKKDYDKLKKSK